jgi:hypothetical protein
MTYLQIGYFMDKEKSEYLSLFFCRAAPWIEASTGPISDERGSRAILI